MAKKPITTTRVPKRDALASKQELKAWDGLWEHRATHPFMASTGKDSPQMADVGVACVRFAFPSQDGVVWAFSSQGQRDKFVRDHGAEVCER